MSEDIFDAIIVGAGLAGSVAALVLAREGAQVLVIERGNSAGAKNVTGGRLYAHSLEHIIPGFADSAPVERLITHEKLAFMTEKSAMTMDYCNGDETSPSQRSYSVLRSKFDAWLMEQAEEAGAQLITGIRVDNLVQRDGKVVGVEADGDVIEAKTVILADGVNSILAEKLGMAKRVKPTDVAVGVKELIELPKSVIEDRFQLQGNQGAACLFAGSPTDGLMGGGFLYTNENTLSLALAVLGLIPDMGIWLVVMAFAVYAFFSGGPGNLQWLYPNELFPTDIRASAVGVIMSLSRIGTIVSTWALPIFINNYGISNTMLMGAGISLFGLLISVAFAPETRGMSLAQTSNMTIRGQRMG